MDVMNQVLVLFLLILCGFTAIKAGWIREGGIQGLNAMVLYFSLPCLTVAKLQQEASPGLMLELSQVFVIGAVSILLSGAVAWYAVFRREERPRRAVLTSMAMFSNAGFMGFPVLSAALGEDKLIYGVVYVGVFNLINWSIGIILFDRRAMSWKRLLCVPCLSASIVGLILFVANIRLPSVLTNALDMLGNTTTPLAMMIVGARLTKLKLADLGDVKLLLACALRLLIFPLAVYGASLLLGVSEWVRGTLTLCTAMPCAAGLVIQAETYGGDGPMASRGVAVSTLLSAATIPLMLIIL